jgi:hypothetical protein
MKKKVSAIKFVCGIDVSGDTLDVCYQTAEGTSYVYNSIKLLPFTKQIFERTGGRIR